MMKVLETPMYEGLPGLILKHDELGHLCGYVGVPISHLLFGLDYSAQIPGSEETIEGTFSVHGGITFSGVLDEGMVGYWYFGFDCAHAGDLVPGTGSLIRHNPSGVYRDELYVMAEIENLAAQLAVYKSL